MSAVGTGIADGSLGGYANLMNAREEVLANLDALEESELREVAQFVRFIVLGSISSESLAEVESQMLFTRGIV